MNRSFRVLTFLFFIAVLAVVSFASPEDEPIDVNDIKDPAMREHIIRQIEAKGEEEEIDSSRAPPTSTIAAERRLPYPLCGVFILCERKGGRYGFPDARLFTGIRTRIFPKTVGSCRTTFVKGMSGPSSSLTNHAQLWPIFGEEFNELCFYYERQHACETGQVQVVNSSNDILYQCDRFYDAHTVQFCMSKYPYYCRFRNPAEIIFATTSAATSQSA